MIIEGKKVGKKIAQRQIELRAKLWPDVNPAHLWSRKVSDGFTTIPRTLPLFMVMMDCMSKGKPLSSTYFELWCRAFDDCLVVLNKPKEMAFFAGFSGQRAEQTWSDRIRKLADLGFISVKPGPSGPLSYCLILSPYRVIRDHHKKQTPGLTDDLYNALLARASEIGAEDLNSPILRALLA